MGRRRWWNNRSLTIFLSMRKRPFLLGAGLLTACLTFFQAGHAQKDHTLLWKVSGKGLAKPSYLFGTMHVLCADDAHLSDSLRWVIAKCEEVYFEINLSDMSAMMNSLKYMRMNDSKKL